MREVMIQVIRCYTLDVPDDVDDPETWALGLSVGEIESTGTLENTETDYAEEC